MDALADARYADLEFNAPLSSAHARELIAGLGPMTGATIVDLGCGWAEFLLRLLDQEPTARGVGVDRDSALIARARRSAESRGLRERVRFEGADATAWSDPADVAIVVGSSHAWGGTHAALNAIRSLLAPDGRVLLGETVWERSPTPAALAALDAQPDDFTTIDGLVDVCGECGFTVAARSSAATDEWDSFEARFLSGRENWLARNPDAPEADDVRAEVEAHRDGYLHGYRGILGFAYLILAVR